jgi:hypothetical protein
MSPEEKPATQPLRVNFEGAEVPAEEVEFEIEREGWSVYVLEDGTRIKMKNIVARVFRLIDRYKEDGEPLYLLHGSPVISSIVPGHLKKPATRE